MNGVPKWTLNVGRSLSVKGARRSDAFWILESGLARQRKHSRRLCVDSGWQPGEMKISGKEKKRPEPR